MKKIRIVPSITNRDDLSLKLYFKDIYKYPILSLEEEQKLFKEANNGDNNALQKVIQSNLRFVITVAKQYQGQGISLVDLINEGNIGLCIAAKKFDNTRGFKFISYAVWWIRQSILQAIYNTSRTIRYPITYISKLTKVNKTISKLESEYDRPPTLKELSKNLNVSEDEINDVLLNTNSCSSMDIQIGDDDNSTTIGDLLSNGETADQNLMFDSNKFKIRQILSKLKNREADIIRMYYGIDSQELSLEEIGTRFGMTGERIRQLKEEILNKLFTNYSNELRELL